jgi:hypothetical protein
MINSAIQTIENAIHGLKIEIRIWSDPRNYHDNILKVCKKELIEHETALEILKEAQKTNSHRNTQINNCNDGSIKRKPSN